MFIKDLKGEIGFYDELGKKVIAYLNNLHPMWELAYSQHKMLPQMVSDIEGILGGETLFHNKFIPALDLDLVVGIKSPEHQNKIVLVLFEIKYQNSLKLINYSQMLGYMMTATQIRIGILLNVIKGTPPANPLSNDFSELFRMNSLSMSFSVHQKKIATNFDFKTGICYCNPHSLVRWLDSSQCLGISSWEQLADEIEADFRS